LLAEFDASCCEQLRHFASFPGNIGVVEDFDRVCNEGGEKIDQDEISSWSRALRALQLSSLLPGHSQA
jgi:hypothetical protein